MMHVLLGSGGFRTEERVALLSQHMRAHFGHVSRLLFVPYALHDHDAYVQTLVSRGLNAGYELDGLHRHVEPRAAVAAAEAIYVGGGNTFRLLDTLYRLDLLDVLRERIRAGVPFLGVSAGCNVACPTIKTTNDMPIVQPPSFDALGLVPFQVNAHYYEGHNWVRHGAEFVEHFGETRDDRLREFHEMNDTPVVGLCEGGLLHCRDSAVTLHGAPARLFRKGCAPLDLTPGADVAAALVASS